MSTQDNSLLSNILESGHTFEEHEILLRFQYRVINGILIVMALFTLIFALLSSYDINPLGKIQTIADYILSTCSVILVFRLRGPKKNYTQNAYLMYAVAMMTFISALLFVPHDEFRIIWFYLLAFAAYITGGVKAGTLISVISIVIVIVADNVYDLQLSETAIVSSLMGLAIASLFFRIYTKKIHDFEQEITEQRNRLKSFNEALASEVSKKTHELNELNASLEEKVAQKVEQITTQERMMITQSRLATMGEMMSMIAHQWRQPLSTTTLMITNARMKAMLEGQEDDEHTKLLDEISETMLYLSDTIDDFQTYFKPNKETENIEISNLMERIESFIASRLKLSKVKLSIEGATSDTIDTYANEVVQVVINIINNAIDVLQERKTEEANIWIRLKCDDAFLNMRIEDNAGGIDEEIIDRVFEPYFSQKSKNGTGLGLYMAKMIVESHMHGTLDVENTERGACFNIRFPKNVTEIKEDEIVE